jgi:hypothetical protein
VGRTYRADGGKICALSALLVEHGEAVEADLAFRGIDLLDLWRGGLSYRRLGLLIAALPPESLTKTAARNVAGEEAVPAQPEPGIHGQWSNAELLLASISDGVAVLAWQQSQINGGKKSDPPAQLRRPGVAEKAPTGRAVTAKGLRYLNNLRTSRITEGEDI